MRTKIWRTCPDCRGQGYRLWTRGRPDAQRLCQRCKGKGEVQVAVTIPPKEDA